MGVNEESPPPEIAASKSRSPTRSACSSMSTRAAPSPSPVGTHHARLFFPCAGPRWESGSSSTDTSTHHHRLKRRASQPSLLQGSDPYKRGGAPIFPGSPTSLCRSYPKKFGSILLRSCWRRPYKESEKPNRSGESGNGFQPPWANDRDRSVSTAIISVPFCGPGAVLYRSRECVLAHVSRGGRGGEGNAGRMGGGGGFPPALLSPLRQTPVDFVTLKRTRILRATITCARALLEASTPPSPRTRTRLTSWMQ